MGFLYIIQSKALVKIGITADIRRRMNELKPDRIHQVVKLSRERELEKKLHRLFAEKRLPGSEYFRLSWAERRRACRLARRAGKRFCLPHPAPGRRGTPGLRPALALEICGIGLAVGVAAVLIARSPAGGTPPEAPPPLAVPTKSFVSGVAKV